MHLTLWALKFMEKWLVTANIVICVFSFHPVKNITTGEGGIVSTNSKFYIEKVKILRTHGINKDKKYFY